MAMPPSSEAVAKPGRILIVDDKPANLLALELVLEPLQRPIVRAASGQDALRQLLRGEFAVVVMDISMPGLDGIETAALIRERESTRTLPIIFVTAERSDLSQVHQAYSLGSVDYIVKPLDPLVIRSKVSTFVQLYEQADALHRAAQTLARESDRRIEAEEAITSKDLSIAILGHDLRTPLGVVLTGMEILRGSPLADEHGVLLRRMERSIHRMSQLVSDILDFARASAGKPMPVVPGPADVAAILREVVEELRQVHPTRDIQLEVPATASAVVDAGRIAQVCSNLLGNALQHSDGDPVRVTVEELGACLRLTVSNPGAIDPDALPRLFDPFRRGDSSANGLGLGLFIVREIARAHQGRVDVSVDAEGGETRFVFELPRAAVFEPVLEPA
jgi:signal transduction histidine kinase